MTIENIDPAQTAPASPPDGVEAMLARLPAAYAEWERDCASAEVGRLQSRVEHLLGRGGKDDQSREQIPA